MLTNVEKFNSLCCYIYLGFAEKVLWVRVGDRRQETGDRRQEAGDNPLLSPTSAKRLYECKP
ncbi:MAG: hypothetical protein F6K24_24725 [Okeania sp. SIO2D1]|nr:hypothetical protein [Okeania sp. SIO2D1]